MIAFSQHVQDGYRSSAEWREVAGIADALRERLDSPGVRSRLERTNAPGRSSAEVQAVVAEAAGALGFTSERAGLFADRAMALRPDFFLALGQSGILLEVERGKTTINNMDLLDFWKCHLLRDAHYLFLCVPNELRQNATMSPRREFASVERRLAAFFEPDSYTNVRGLCLFGY